MNDEHFLKGAFEGITFGPVKYGEFSAAPTVDLANGARALKQASRTCSGTRC